MTVTVRTRDTPIGERDPRPVVGAPPRRVPAVVIAAAALLAALLLFLFLASQRQSAPLAASGEDQEVVPYAPPPPLVVPSDTVPQPTYAPLPPVRPSAPAPVSVIAPAPAPVPQPVRERYRDPPPQPQIFYPPPQPERINTLPPRTRGASGEPALVLDTSAEIPIGTLIPAVLETPIDTSRPGFARAIVTRDARGSDGQRVIVPRGSRLIGEYQSDVRPGQNRVLVNWTRLVRPDGAAVRLGVPSADESGAAGIPGNYHSFFLKRFFNATLQTALSVGGNLIGRNNTGNTVVVGNTLGSSATGAAAGLFSSEVRPKITIKSGTLFNVFVAREIDLSATTSPN